MPHEIVCPNCHKTIKEQASVQIPTKTFPVTDAGVTHASLVVKDGKTFLVFESLVECPFCKELFGYDVWIETTHF